MKKAMSLPKTKITHEDIANLDGELENCSVYVDLGLSEMPDFHLEAGATLVVTTEQTAFITVPGSADGIVDIEECSNLSRQIPKKQKRYQIKIDGEKHIVPSPSLTGQEILELAGLEWQRFDLQKKISRW